MVILTSESRSSKDTVQDFKMLLKKGEGWWYMGFVDKAVLVFKGRNKPGIMLKEWT